MQLNHQAIEKRVAHPEGLLDVHSIFYTIQGEGPFCGTPCIFIRLAGCNLQCPWCDTEYTQGRQFLSPGEIYRAVLDKWHKDRYQAPGLVVITGGEPFRQDIAALLTLLVERGFYVQIESNGTLPPSFFYYNIDTGKRKGAYIVCSPKAGRVNPTLAIEACCFKYVVSHDSQREEDGLPLQALGHSANPFVARPPEWWDRPIYIQPMDAQDPEENERNIQAAKRASLRFGYILQLQIHKLIGVE
jgi:7-carboxy-7-deazaguanine synthase